MPVLKHAKKKLRQDVKRTLENKAVKNSFKNLVKIARLKPTKSAVSAAYKAIDKAAKANIIHENKAARLKSSLAKAGGGASSLMAPSAKKRLTKTARAKANKQTTVKAEAPKAKAAKPKKPAKKASPKTTK